MSWDRSLRIFLSVAVIAAFAACGGGSSVTPLAGSAADSSASVATPPQELQIAQAPTSTIKQIDAVKGRDDLNLGLWQFEEPLQIVSDDTLSLPRFSAGCSVTDPLFGIWYLSLKSFTVAQQPVTIQACNFKSKGVSVANFYIVEIDVSLSSVVIQTLSDPVTVDANGEWTFYANAKGYEFAADNLYAFWVANYTGSGTPGETSVSL